MEVVWGQSWGGVEAAWSGVRAAYGQYGSGMGETRAWEKCGGCVGGGEGAA